jgi:hypothetical protein
MENKAEYVLADQGRSVSRGCFEGDTHSLSCPHVEIIGGQQKHGGVIDGGAAVASERVTDCRFFQSNLGGLSKVNDFSLRST